MGFPPVVCVLVFAMERAGKAARAAMETADAANWRRENTLLRGIFVFPFSKCGSRLCDLRFHPVVGPVLPFSTSRERKFCCGKESALAYRSLQPGTGRSA